MTLHGRSEYLLKEWMKKLHCKNKFNFVFFEDSRCNGPEGSCFKMGGEFELLLQRAVKLDPLFIIHGGDKVYTVEKKYV